MTVTILLNPNHVNGEIKTMAYEVTRKKLAGCKTRTVVIPGTSPIFHQQGALTTSMSTNEKELADGGLTYDTRINPPSLVS